jgi:hypothetical protein
VLDRPDFPGSLSEGRVVIASDDRRRADLEGVPGAGAVPAGKDDAMIGGSRVELEGNALAGVETHPGAFSAVMYRPLVRHLALSREVRAP